MIGCRFCLENIADRIIGTHRSFVAISDGFPVSKGHILLIPTRHCSDYFELFDFERYHAYCLMKEFRDMMMEIDPTITGFNIGMNCGASAGQTIFHTHIHLIPRRDGDTPNPRGGVRGVIPDKMSY